MLPVAAEACFLLCFAPHLPLRRPVLVIYELLRIAVDASELLVFALEQEVSNTSAGRKRPLKLRILLEPVLCLRSLIVDDWFRPA